MSSSPNSIFYLILFHEESCKPKNLLLMVISIIISIIQFSYYSYLGDHPSIEFTFIYYYSYTFIYYFYSLFTFKGWFLSGLFSGIISLH